MRVPEAFLLDILAASERIASYIDGMTRSAFAGDAKTKAAVVREIEIIGEAANRLPAQYRDAHPEVPWMDLARLRNLYIHVYERVNYDRVWLTATRTIPRVADVVAKLVPLEAEDPGPSSGSPAGD
ncbi:MAG: DUF86 domain-containing protein [Armatimonadetes bacterium]|nr:DUF86 domain-containing protein [Armatimonadota bacterium]